MQLHRLTKGELSLCVHQRLVALRQTQNKIRRVKHYLIMVQFLVSLGAGEGNESTRRQRKMQILNMILVDAYGNMSARFCTAKSRIESDHMFHICQMTSICRSSNAFDNWAKDKWKINVTFASKNSTEPKIDSIFDANRFLFFANIENDELHKLQKSRGFCFAMLGLYFAAYMDTRTSALCFNWICFVSQNFTDVVSDFVSGELNELKSVYSPFAKLF